MPKTVVITGASDGIGAAAARRLAAAGDRVVVVGRSPERTRAVAEEIGADHHLADFADLAQVRRLAEELLAAYPSIEVLANNAGGIMGARQTTVDGYEKTFQVNHLAPFLLTRLLMPSLVAGRATVIQTASIAARVLAKFDVEDLQAEHAYSAQAAYGNAKLANILFTSELQRRSGDQGISAVAFHPGVVATSFASDTTSLMRFIYHTPLKRLFTIRPDKAADELVWLAEGTPGETFTPGAYYESKVVAQNVNPLSLDADLAARLWDESEEMVAPAGPPG